MLSGGAVGRAWAVAAAPLLARSSAEKNFEVFNIFISNIGMTDGSAVHREGEEVEVVTFPTKGTEGVEGGGRTIEGFKVGLTFVGDPERVGGGLCGGGEAEQEGVGGLLGAKGEFHRLDSDATVVEELLASGVEPIDAQRVGEGERFEGVGVVEGEGHLHLIVERTIDAAARRQGQCEGQTREKVSNHGERRWGQISLAMW
jgi:hypothetical protein